MKKIYTAVLSAANTENEYAWTESSECEYGEEWDGNVLEYVENAIDSGFDAEISDNYAGSIHNLPENAIVIVKDRKPIEIYWAE